MTSEVDTSEFGAPDLAAAREAGADDLLIMVASVDPDAVSVDYNHVYRTLANYDDMKQARDRAGHFIGALWDGDLAEALYRADVANKKLLLRLFAEDVLMAALIEDRGSEESARRWLDPYIEKYGWSAEDFE